ncbi:PDDEXK family nuclease [Rhizobium leguminosarum]|uniref:hypothetical protein n=1 Tax=Rhizobium leguminosarum TaxID=384 RepID=UPI003D0222E4
MNQKAVLRYMKEQRFGLFRDRDWGTVQALEPDENCRGTFESITVVSDDGEVVEDKLYVPIAHSTGTRQPTPRTKAHSRGYLPDPGTRRSVGFSSTLELHCALMLMANRFVVDVEDQPPAITYYDDDGKPHEHTFDFRARFRSGNYLAFAVKPLQQVRTTGLRDQIKRIRRVLGEFASDAIIITDCELTPARAWNAKSILRARRFHNAAKCEEMRAFVKTLTGAVSAFDVAMRFDDFGEAINAIWYLLYEGVLEQLNPAKKLFDEPYVKLAAGGEARKWLV